MGNPVIIDRLLRFGHAPDYTYGLWLPQGMQYPDAFTLEDEGRVEKVNGEARIPADTYEVVLNDSLGYVSPLTERYRKKFDWFDWHLMLKDVKGFKYVYVHIGNTDENTDACILVANTCDLTPPTTDGFIGESTDCYKRLYQRIRGLMKTHRVYLKIQDQL